MKNFSIKTIEKAIENGFEIDEKFKKSVIDFLNENLESLDTIEDECEVRSSGRSQYVSHYGNGNEYRCDGEILQYGMDYWRKDPNEKIYHSNFLYLEDDGTPKNMKLFQLVGENEYNKES